MRFSVVLIPVIASFVLSGCSVLRLDKVLPDKRTEYEKSERLPDLEVPPDLSTDAIQDRMAIPEASGTATYSTYQQRQAGKVVDRAAGASEPGAVIAGAGDHSVVVPTTADILWPKLQNFSSALDYQLDRDEPGRAMMETEWRENSTDLVRDRFRLTTTPQSGGATSVRVVHMGEELAPNGEDHDWRARPRDAELERKLAERLAGFLGDVQPTASSYAAVTDTAAPTASAPTAASGDELAELVNIGEGKLYLNVQRERPEVWRITGLALDQAGITVEEADESEGVYRVRYLEQVEETAEEPKKKRLLSRLAFWRKGDENNQQFQLSLTAVGNKTEIVVLNEKGDWDTSKKSEQILVSLRRELNSLN